MQQTHPLTDEHAPSMKPDVLLEPTFNKEPIIKSKK